jgi:hypothetical protein
VSMIPKKPAPDLIRVGTGFRTSMPSGSTRGIMLKQAGYSAGATAG